jgi:hypothetical protein
MRRLSVLLLLLTLTSCSGNGQANRYGFDSSAWPNTDFSRTQIDLSEVIEGGPGKDGIPSIDAPVFVSVRDYPDADPLEPVIGVVIDGQARAYPLRVLTWHEIVNDQLAGVPIAVTYCPLCNTSIVFDRRHDGHVLDFGTTGNLRHSDLIMYDRQTESWWQQYGGQAIVGEYAGDELVILASRLESLENFRARAPEGQVLVPNDPRARDYGRNPYAGYDQAAAPFLFRGRLPREVSAMMRVVAIDDVAFALPLLMEQGQLSHEDLQISWQAGQRTALGHQRIDQGADVGNVTVKRNGSDEPYLVTFAFAFFAFNADGVLYTENGPVRNQSAEQGDDL